MIKSKVSNLALICSYIATLSHKVVLPRPKLVSFNEEDSI